MLYVRLDKELVGLPSATMFRRARDEMEFLDGNECTVAKCCAGHVVSITPDKLGIASELLEEDQDDQPMPADWDGS
jgi:hypothetical protein